MASSSLPGRDEAGFATPAAAGVSLAIAITAAAVMTQSVVELRRARSDYERAQIDYALDGAALSAEIAVLDSKPAERLAWRLSSTFGAIDVLAEAEAPKLSLASASNLDANLTTRLGVADPQRLQARLAALGSGPKSGLDIARASEAALWRACGRSLISPWGLATSAHLAPSGAPIAATGGGRLGEVWRLRIGANGFTDERVVRFTGDPQRPAAIVERRLYRTPGKGDTCDALATVKPQS